MSPIIGHTRIRLALALALSVFFHLLVFGNPGWHSPAGGAPARGLTVSLAAKNPTAMGKREEVPLQHEAQEKWPPKQTPETSPSHPIENSTNNASSHQDSGLVFGPWYYTSKWLHRRPTPLKPIQPEYPPHLADKSAHVRLLLLINEQGTVDKHQLIAPSEEDAFTLSAITAFRTALYAPGMITGYTVRSQLLVDIIFEPGQAPSIDLPIDPDVTQLPINR